MLLVEQIGHCEVEARVIVRDAASVDHLLDHRAQKMRRCVKTHVTVAPVPVDLRAYGGANGEVIAPVTRGIDHMQSVVRRGVFALDLARIHHAQPRAVSGDDESRVAGLPTAERIENGAVELDTVIADPRDAASHSRR